MKCKARRAWVSGVCVCVCVCGDFARRMVTIVATVASVRASDAQRRRGGGGRQRGGEVGGLVEAVHLKLHYQRRPRGVPLANQRPDLSRRGRKLA